MVSERRPHWTDDLLLSFTRAMGMHTCDERVVYAGIAAVEDWQKPSLDDLQRENLRDLVEAVQRVREIHQPHRCRMSTRHIDCSIMFGGECSHEGKCQVCREKYPCATICALVGDGDE